MSFRRIAIVNRGEPAMRLIHAVREINAERGQGFVTIALHTDPDRNSLYVREADEAYCIGPAQSEDASGRRRSSYLDHARLERAIKACRADAAWVGWGFVAEDPGFADLCEQLSVVFIGPRGAVMRKLGDKIAAKTLAEAANVPVAPWSRGAITDEKHLLDVAEQIEYPLLIKAAAGGGGRGIRRVHSEAQLVEAWQSARNEAHAAFGDAAVFVEKAIGNARHIEVQIVADSYGNCWPIGLRDCSVQRRQQKVIEEAPPPGLPPAIDHAMREASKRLALQVGYTNAGTVEFLYDPESESFYFMEMNTRLQVEHPVTEALTGIDLVKLQLHVATGGQLAGDPPSERGHAIEVRLNAEDPDQNFAPAPGHVECFRLPSGPGLRVDTGITAGDSIPADFDSMVAKIIAWGTTRDEALARLTRALVECLVVVDGGATNKAFLLETLQTEAFRAGRVDIGWLDRRVSKLKRQGRPHAELALVRAAIAVADVEHHAERAQFISSAIRGRMKTRSECGVDVEFRAHGEPYKLRVFRVGIDRYHVHVDGWRIAANIERLSEHESWITVGHRRHRAVLQERGVDFIVEIDGIPHRIVRDEGGMVRAPAPAIVVGISVEEGQRVEAGDRLALLEAMKVELPVVAPGPARVRQVLVAPNTHVEAMAPLLVLEPIREGSVASGPAERVIFADIAIRAEQRDPARVSRNYRRDLRLLRPLLLGFDIPEVDAEKLIARVIATHAELSDYDPPSMRLEQSLLGLFVDVIDAFPGSASPGVEQYLHLYSQTHGQDDDGPPQAVQDPLLRLLRHYNIDQLERSAEVEDAFLFGYRAFKRVATKLPLIEALLHRQLIYPVDAAEQPFKDVLDRLINTSRDRFRRVHDLARQAQYYRYARPLFAEAQDAVYRRLDSQLQRLVREPMRHDRDDHLQLLVNCPQPLTGFLSAWLRGGSLEIRQLLLEVFVRRFYHRRALEQIEAQTVEGQPFLTASFAFEQRQLKVVASHCSFDDLSRTLELVNRLADRHGDADVMIEIFVDVLQRELQPVRDSAMASFLGDSVKPPREYDRAEEIDRLMSSWQTSASTKRACICLVSPSQRRALDYLTYAKSPNGLRQVTKYRGLHPMWAGRMQLWRLRNFETKRLPAPADTYLFHAVARENPRDERLVAFVEARDISPSFSGEQLELPHFERIFLDAMATIRDALRQHNPQGRMQWNRVVFYVWPGLTVELEDLARVIRRLEPAIRGNDLEKIVLIAKVPHNVTGSPTEQIVHFTISGDRIVRMRVAPPSEQPMRALSPYSQRVIWARTRMMAYPYEIIRMLAPESEGTSILFPRGVFTEYDLTQGGEFVAVKRPYGENTANVVVGTITNYTDKHPEGMTRVILLGDPTREMGALAQPECERIIAAIDLATRLGVPVEWFPVSSGAKISLESGTENLDWTARVLQRLITFTQAAGEVNIVVNGVNVGAQSYWNAEATMLMHTRGILVMTAQASMVLTGKKALEYAGSVAAEDHQGIGGADRIMGPNGQAQYIARDLTEACLILYRHYDFTYVCPGERLPRSRRTSDPAERDVTVFPHTWTRGGGDPDFALVGDVFSPKKNPQRKRPFDMRSVMRSVTDQDRLPLERWASMVGAESAIVWEAYLGGHPVTLIGMESASVKRAGFVPGDGPAQWSAGTLFPLSSKKVSRAINAASGHRPIVILANLSGFDGSPESMRNLQLEYGAEIGRAVVNFQGPIIFCVVSRYHGGAYVVFSRALNESIESLAVGGAYASVIGGAPAAAVVLTRDVRQRTHRDPRVVQAQAAYESANPEERLEFRTRLNDTIDQVMQETQRQVAEEFDRVHSIQRAVAVGSIDRVIAPSELRPQLIAAVERGIERATRKLKAVAAPG
ncbi:MAG: ATP-grasp domain-containing protein [Deltaproteobacteria bacterium]|nr:ATP-grasp domain-containing protein [Deltaproteobacteria bacterium]